MLRLADSYMTASFMRHLKGDTEAGKAFKSEEAGQFSRTRLPTSDKPPPDRALSPAFQASGENLQQLFPGKGSKAVFVP